MVMSMTVTLASARGPRLSIPDRSVTCSRTRSMECRVRWSGAQTLPNAALASVCERVSEASGVVPGHVGIRFGLNCRLVDASAAVAQQAAQICSHQGP